MGKEMIAMLLAGGQGSRLYALTQKLAKPAVPFGGKYRIIDFPLSNCVNSGIDTVGILTQYQPLELNEYIGMGNRGIWTESMEEFMYYHHIRRHLAQIGIKVQQMQFTRIFHLSSAMIRNMSLFYREIRSASRIIVIFLDSTKKRTQNSVLRLWKSRGRRHQDSDLWSRTMMTVLRNSRKNRRIRNPILPLWVSTYSTGIF